MYKSLWYDNLTKPFLQPPAWIFPPVWIILYGTILTSLILYSITVTGKSKLSGYICFIVHMVFNLLWSPVFFKLHRPDIALGIILIMVFTAVLVIYKFYRISRISGIILVPYFLWLLFAVYLNLQICILN